MAEQTPDKPAEPGGDPGHPYTPRAQPDRTPEAREAERQRMVDRIRPYQWKPGQSGNPNGGRTYRARRTQILTKALVEAVESKQVTVKENGRDRTMPIAEAIVMRLIQLAINDGDPRAMKLIREMVDLEPEETPQGLVTPETVAEIVAEVLGEGGAEAAAEIERRVREAASGSRVTIRYE